MRIFIDIGHPAHVHYFKNLIRIMEKNGHTFFIMSRDKEVAFKLLDSTGHDYKSRGTGGNGYLSKFFYLMKAEKIIYKHAKVFKPDVFLSFSSPYAAHVSKLLGKPHITIDDTEHARLDHILYPPFTDTILNPASYFANMGKKQIRFNGFMELCYLHPKYFQPDPEILTELGINSGEKYIFLRFISWTATHDIGQGGMNVAFQMDLVEKMHNKYKIFISSEGDLPELLLPYKVTVSPEKIHHVLAFSSLFIGEGATMASECAMLGIPAIYVNSLTAGTLEEQEKYGLIFGFRNTLGVIEKANELLSRPNLASEFQEKRMKMLKDKIDVTAFLIWFLENYPQSIRIMKENPAFQERFK
ncbi:MAG: DUF354 domain-containing protein [Bacteroidetes bacterium]|nr:DUF354 domain-containing protein [Bacteroidota bacterium]